MDMIGLYIINLDRSSARWDAILSQANKMGLRVERVSGVDGRDVDQNERVDVNESEFIRRNGRSLLPGEYGCYKSHIAVLEQFLLSSYPTAVVMEDDVEFPENFMPRLDAIHKNLPSAEIVKLLNHRAKGFRETTVTIYGDRIGRCIHGPQGSAACYMITRTAARKLLEKIKIMQYPYDIALERGWKTGVSIYTVQTNIAKLSKLSHGSQIADRDQYRAVKIRGVRRIATHMIRAIDYVRRIRYALSW